MFRDTGSAAAAFVYLGRGASGGAALPGYMEHVIAMARAANLPREHVMELERHLPAKSAPAAPAGLPNQRAVLASSIDFFREDAMAKGQMKSNKETKKPKKDAAAKVKPGAEPLSQPPLSVAKGKPKK